MSPAAFGLGIDFGTSNTVAMLRWPDGRVKPLLFEGSPLLPSAVFAPADGGALIVGTDALHHARFSPQRLEPNPKRHIDEVSVLLGDREVTVVELVAAVLRHVADEAVRVTGGYLPSAALSHPAGWGPLRRSVIVDAAAAAGLGPVLLVPEPTAAANYFTAVLERDLAIGKALVVYDLGAGTFDASVVRRVATGFEVVAVDGLDDVGGLDVDAAIVGWLRASYSAREPEVWARLTNPVETDDRRQRRMLWDDVRVAKEMLSRAPAVLLHLPLADVDAQLTRDEFEGVAQPLLERTVRTVQGLIRYAELPAEDLAGLLLVGGSSRIPLVATLLHRAVGVAPTATEQPELVVAEGTLQSVERPASVSAAPVSAAPVSAAPVSPTGTVYRHGQVPAVAAIRPSAEQPGPVSGPPSPSSGPPSPGGESRVIPLWTIPVDSPRPAGGPEPAPSQGSRSSTTLVLAGILVMFVVIGITAGIAWRLRPGQNHVGAQSSSPAAAGFGAQTGASATATSSTSTPSVPVGNGGQTCNPCYTYVTVPDVENQYKDYAASQLRNIGLKVGAFTYETNPCVSVDTVIRTMPPAGQRVVEGSTVTLVLADANPLAKPCAGSSRPPPTPTPKPTPSA
jgi:hypothetical protein